MKPFILKEYLTRLLLALLLFQAVLLCAFEVYNIAAIRERERASLWHILSLYESELEEGMKQTDHDLGDILSRKYQLQILKSSSDLRRSYAGRELQEDMESRLRGNGYADAYVILDRTHGEFIMARSSDISYEETGALREFFLERMGAGQGNSGWTTAELSTGRCLVHYFNYGGGGGTLVGAVVSLRTLEEIIGAGQNGVLRFALYDREGKLVYAMPEESEDSAGAHIAGEIFGIRLRIPVYDGSFELEGSNPDVSLLGDQANLLFSLFLAVLGILLTAAVFTLYFRRFVKREIISPLGEMAEVSESIRNGQWDRKLDLRCKSREFLELQNAYNMMLDTILQLRMEQYERIIRMKDLELRYLHMQLKPHFFLNVLSSINSLSYQHKDEEIRAYIQALSGHIRYMFRTGMHTVPLREEILALQNYLEIQRQLYRDCFYFYMEVPEKIQGWQVPQMLLHTFAENVFKHVVEPDTFTTVLLQCAEKEWNGETMLRIRMENSGKPFPEEVLLRMSEPAGEIRRTGGGVGLGNIRLILEYMYGRRDLLHLENDAMGGARITVYIPEKPAEEKKV